MRKPDETDLEIIRLLTEDSRRPYSEIAEHVGLSPPAVSDRIDRLEELDIIQQFTIDVDRMALENRVPVVLQLTVEPSAVEDVFEQVYALDATEHVFLLYDGRILAHVDAPDRDVHTWFHDVLDLEPIDGYEITPLARSEWKPMVDPADFRLTCVVCDNAVTSTGVTARVDGEIKAFCCETCQAAYERQYDAFAEDTD